MGNVESDSVCGRPVLPEESVWSRIRGTAIWLGKIQPVQKYYLMIFIILFLPLLFCCFISFRSPSLFYLLTVGVEVVYFHLITLRHTPQSVGLLWMRDRPVTETPT
jgi:hypothetical protein